MTQEQKDLLLKDLSARLPYGVKIQLTEYSDLTGEKLPNKIKILDYCMLGRVQAYCKGFRKDEIKPYLFPLSSMTDKQKEELFFNYIHNDIYFDDFTDYFLAGELWHDICVSIDVLPELINWLNKHHLDWRGLIPKGLAKDATGLNIY